MRLGLTSKVERSFLGRKCKCKVHCALGAEGQSGVPGLEGASVKCLGA